jgi:hypothetical protein
MWSLELLEVKRPRPIVLKFARWEVVSHMGKLRKSQCKCFGKCLVAGCWQLAGGVGAYVLKYKRPLT